MRIVLYILQNMKCVLAIACFVVVTQKSKPNIAAIAILTYRTKVFLLRCIVNDPRVEHGRGSNTPAGPTRPRVQHAHESNTPANPTRLRVQHARESNTPANPTRPRVHVFDSRARQYNYLYTSIPEFVKNKCWD